MISHCFTPSVSGTVKRIGGFSMGDGYKKIMEGAADKAKGKA
jgi:hypothetical protein